MSATSRNVHKGHCGKLEDAPHLILRGPYEWDRYVPAYYSVETIWAESAMKAVREMEMPGLIEKFNYSFLAAYALFNNRSIGRLALRKTFDSENYFVANDPWLKLKFIGSTVRILSDFIGRKLKRKFRIKAEQIVSFYGVGTISEAVKHYRQWTSID